jgi:hypothetical protein
VLSPPRAAGWRRCVSLLLYFCFCVDHFLCVKFSTLFFTFSTSLLLRLPFCLMMSTSFHTSPKARSTFFDYSEFVPRLLLPVPDKHFFPFLSVQVSLEPDVFRPERFLTPDAGMTDEYTLSIICGRRVYLGMHVAQQSSFILASRYVFPAPYVPMHAPLTSGHRIIRVLDIIPGRDSVHERG